MSSSSTSLRGLVQLRRDFVCVCRTVHPFTRARRILDVFHENGFRSVGELDVPSNSPLITDHRIGPLLEAQELALAITDSSTPSKSGSMLWHSGLVQTKITGALENSDQTLWAWHGWLGSIDSWNITDLIKPMSKFPFGPRELQMPFLCIAGETAALSRVLKPVFRAFEDAPELFPIEQTGKHLALLIG